MGFTPKITDQDKALLDVLGLSSEQRVAAEAKILQKKAENVARAVETRTQFSIKAGKSDPAQMSTVGGLGYRFPTTLPDGAWLLLSERMPEIVAFIRAKKK